MKPLRTDTKIFKKKKCQEILRNGFISKEESNFLLELIKNHPDYDLKAGCGISDFFIKKTSWGNNGFYIKRMEGTETDFSYIQCLNPTSKLQDIKTACRSAISEDMVQVSRKGYIAHHEVPFIDIFNLWFKDKNIDEIELNESKDNCVIIYFKDNCVAEDFRKFHNSMARIKEVTPQEHKKIHSRGSE